MSYDYLYNDVSMYYDLMYVNEESYKIEAEKVVSLASQHGLLNGSRLLDIACGTGAQAEYLQKHYNVTGIDLNENMLQIARKKVESAEFIKADMCNFSLPAKFDIVVNLYGSIGHAANYSQLCSAIECVYKHLKKDGIFILTPWGTKESFEEALVTKSKTINLSGFCRMETVSRLSDDKVKVEMHHLVSDNLNVTYHNYTQTITLFSEDEYISSIVKTGFKIIKRLSQQEFRMGAFICIL